MNEGGTLLSGNDFSGTFATQASGYGSFRFTTDSTEEDSIWGVYMTDPTLNLIDPNSSVVPSSSVGSGATGGALIAEMDTLVGTGFRLPQTDTATASFTGAYGFGGQFFTKNLAGWESDFLGQGTITTLVFGNNSPGFLNDLSGHLLPRGWTRPRHVHRNDCSGWFKSRPLYADRRLGAHR